MSLGNIVARRFGDTLDPSTPYLSLTVDDIRTLKYDWLADSHISFWEEWLEREVLPKYRNARIVLLRPSMTTLLLFSEPKNIVGTLPDFRKVTHIFVPVTNVKNPTKADGGDHWSLLVISIIDRVAFHYDSIRDTNYYEAQKCTDRLSKLLGVPIKFTQMDDCPQQENTSDCGVFVCILMRHLLIKRLLNKNCNEKVSMSMAGKVVDSQGARKEMLKIIEDLRKEAERRRSASPHANPDPTPRIDQ
ncbi:hypothetical protein V8F20_011263 [Naviculisporaceae sp. PSN 640]